jgi:hypothetical protein
MLRGSASIGGASAVMAKACDVMAKQSRGKRSRGTCVDHDGRFTADWKLGEDPLGSMPTPLHFLQPAFG